MATETNLALIKGLYVTFQEGDIPEFVAQLSETVEWIYYGPEAVPWAGTFSGKNEVRRFFFTVRNAAELLDLETTDFVAADECVVVVGRWRARTRNTSREFETQWVHIYTFDDAGKISQVRQIVNTAPIVDALKD